MSSPQSELAPRVRSGGARRGEAATDSDRDASAFGNIVDASGADRPLQIRVLKPWRVDLPACIAAPASTPFSASSPTSSWVPPAATKTSSPSCTGAFALLGPSVATATPILAAVLGLGMALKPRTSITLRWLASATPAAVHAISVVAAGVIAIV